MKRLAAILALIWCVTWAALGVYGACPANNPVSFNSMPIQGPDPTGNQGWPLAVVGATGCPLDVNVVGGGSSCVTQCTSPWVVSGTVAATQSGAWNVGVNNFPATQPVSGTVTANQGTNPWIVAGNHSLGDALSTDRIAALPAQCNTGVVLNPNLTLQPLYQNAAGETKVIASQTTSPWIVGFNGVAQPVSQSGTWNVGLNSGSNTIGKVDQGVGGASAWKVDGSAVTQPVSGTVTANQGTSSYTMGQTITPLGACWGEDSLCYGYDIRAGNIFPTSIVDDPILGEVISDLNLLTTWSVGAAVVDSTTINSLRTPSVFKTVSTAANGSTALWTPAAGKKFRLMRYEITVTANAAAAAAAVKTIKLLDGAGDIAQDVSVFIPAAAATTMGTTYSTGWIDLGNGKLSAAANNVLNVNLSTALTAGVVNVVACGTEE